MNNRLPKDQQIKTLMDITRAALSNYMGQSHDGGRDYYDVYGYPENLSFEHYRSFYERGDIAGRIIEAPANESWRNKPIITDDSDNNSLTDFEKGIEDLDKRTKMFNYMKRADILSGIGEYGVILIGTRGEGDWDDPLPDGSLDGIEDVLYFKAYHQGTADFDEINLITDKNNPDYGKPEYYKIDLTGSNDLKSTTTKVHYSRVIHIAENKLEDEIFGQPRLRRVINRLYDLMKIVGGSAELFWLAADRGLQFNVNEDFDFGEDELKDLKDEVDKYVNGLQRHINTVGVDVNEIGGKVAEPKSIFDNIISLISAATNIPQRILIGSERGNLASSQDEKNWLSHIEDRRNNFVESEIVRPVIDWLIRKGALAEPQEGSYEVEWTDLFKLDDKDKSDILKSVSDSLNKLLSNDLALTMLGEENIYNLIEHYTDFKISREDVQDLGNSIQENNEEISYFNKHLKG